MGLINFIRKCDGPRITERQSQGVMAPAGQRGEYFPVYFVEPLKGNKAAIGFDLGSNPARLEALQNSGDSGELVASSRITLVQEKTNQYGFLVFVPVYRDAAATDAVEDRRGKLIGFVVNGSHHRHRDVLRCDGT